MCTDKVMNKDHPKRQLKENNEECFRINVQIHKKQTKLYYINI